MQQQIDAYNEGDKRAADVQLDEPQRNAREPSADEDGCDAHKRLPVGERHAVEHPLEHAKEDQKAQHEQKDHADGHGKTSLSVTFMRLVCGLAAHFILKVRRKNEQFPMIANYA